MKLDEWFASHRLPAKFEFGARVSGKYNGIPFVGSVGSDGVRNDDEEPHVTVTLDLPLMYKGKVHNVLRVPRKSVKERQ